MKKATMLSTVLFVTALGLTGISQAESTAPATEQAAAPADTAATEAPAEKLTAVPVSPQVQKLINLYPNLIARIQPYGRVCFDGGDCDITITALTAAVDGQPRDGMTIYNAVCKTCHEAGLVGAPKLGDAGAWAPRIAQGKAMLYHNAINGLNAMPAKGGADIADEEVQNAVDYIVEKSS